MFSALAPVFQRFCSLSLRNFMTVSCTQPVKSILLNNAGAHQTDFVSIKPDNMWSLNSVRTNVRCHFPYPREVKRIRCHGFKKRMSTKSGRAILMRRILKGRHVLSH